MIHMLRTIHVVGGVLWVGSIFFFAMFILPSVKAIGPAAGPMMGQLTNARKLPIWLVSLGTFTVVSGVWLYYIDSNGFDPVWMGSGPGRVFGLGGAFAILSYLMGITLNMPLAKKVGAMTAQFAAAGGPPSAADAAKLQAMQMRLGKLVIAGFTLLFLATLCMAVARYVPS